MSYEKSIHQCLEHLYRLHDMYAAKIHSIRIDRGEKDEYKKRLLVERCAGSLDIIVDVIDFITLGEYGKDNGNILDQDNGKEGRRGNVDMIDLFHYQVTGEVLDPQDKKRILESIEKNAAKANKESKENDQ